MINSRSFKRVKLLFFMPFIRRKESYSIRIKTIIDTLNLSRNICYAAQRKINTLSIIVLIIGEGGFSNVRASLLNPLFSIALDWLAQDLFGEGNLRLEVHCAGKIVSVRRSFSCATTRTNGNRKGIS